MALTDRVFIFGPNASGKSNLLDSIRFLRDVGSDLGGLQFAVQQRGGMKRLRFLNSRRNNDGQVMVAISLGDDESLRRWEYELHFKPDKPDSNRPKVTKERVVRDGADVYLRTIADNDDERQATQTALEQVALNGDFLELVDLLRGVDYLHLVPQIVRDPTRTTSDVRDPFGGSFLAEVGRCPKKDWERRRKVMQAALKVAVPQFEALDRAQDKEGHWHLHAKYRHFRPNASVQDERDFSDGTLRLIGLLWTLTDRREPRAPVLLEEPELSLHAEIMRVLPAMLQRASSTSGRQVIASSHGQGLFKVVGLVA